MKKLVDVNFSDNEIIDIPGKFGDLENLHKLNLECNCILALPPELRKLTLLQVLYVHQNRLTQVYFKLN